MQFLFEGPMQDRVGILHRARTKASIELRAIKSLYVSGCKGLELGIYWG